MQGCSSHAIEPTDFTIPGKNLLVIEDRPSVGDAMRCGHTFMTRVQSRID